MYQLVLFLIANYIYIRHLVDIDYTANVYRYTLLFPNSIYVHWMSFQVVS